MLLRSLAVWLIIVVAESVHGVARSVLLQPYMGDFRARQVAVLSGSAIILVISILFVKWIRAGSLTQLIGIGLIWLVLMLGFEIALGRFVMGYSWERLGSDYNIFEGGLLPIGMFVLMAAPLVAAKIRRII